MDWYDRIRCYQTPTPPIWTAERGRISPVYLSGNDKGKNVSINPTGDLSKLDDGSW